MTLSNIVLKGNLKDFTIKIAGTGSNNYRTLYIVMVSNVSSIIGYISHHKTEYLSHSQH